MNCTATDPSPTPEATRFMEPCRTSPTAKIPGTLVSSRNGIAVVRPALRTSPVANKVGPSQQETALVALDHIRQPIGSRQGPNKDKHRACRHALNFAGIGTEHRNLFQVSLAMGLNHAGISPQLDVWSLLDLVDQVT
jgi:hypothetical protein